MSDERGLRFALTLDGQGGAHELGWDDVRTWSEAAGTLWVHLNRNATDAQDWLRRESGVAMIVCNALLAEETRPRCTHLPGGLLLILRGVNLDPEAEPEDMVSLRMWIEPHRIISCRFRHVGAVAEVRHALQLGHGPVGLGDLVTGLAERLVERVSPLVDRIEDRLDELEDSALERRSTSIRDRLADAQRQAIVLRRYLAPQHEALRRLLTEVGAPLSDAERIHLNEVADRVARHVEAIDSVCARAAVTQEQLSSRLTEQMNRIMYLLSVVTTLFLPLTLLTGLLGINVAGIPGALHPYGFHFVILVLVALFGVELAVLRWLRIF